MSELAKSGVSRRTLAKGAAWSLPAVAVAAAAPSVAASEPVPEAGLQGWVNVQKDCNLLWNDTLTWDSQPGLQGPVDPFVPETWGLWVYHSQPNWQFSDVTITIGIPVSGTVTGGGNGWSSPTSVTSPWSGFNAYTTQYTGTWTHHSDPDDDPETYPVAYTKVDGRLRLTASGNFNNCSNAKTLHLRRCVTITRPTPRTGELPVETICFTRTIQL